MKKKLIGLSLLVAFFFAFSAYQAYAALSTNLVGYWKLDESSGSAADSSGNSNTLTNNNTTPFVAAKINNGADLEAGSSQSFSIADASQTGLDFSDALTFAGWIKGETFPATDNPLITKRVGTGNQRAYDFFIQGGNTLHLDTYTDGSASGCSVGVSWSPSTATFYHVAVTKNGTSVKFYVNGSQQGATQTCANATIFNATSPFELGGFAASPDYFDGVLDEWGVWSRALSDAEITSLYNAGAGCAYSFGACEAPATVPDVGTIILFE